MRRESVASLRVRHLDADWGLRGVYVKGGKTRDIPLPSVVMKFLQSLRRARARAEVGAIDARHAALLVHGGRRTVGATGDADDAARTSGGSARRTAV